MNSKEDRFMRNDTNNYQDNNRKTFYHGKRRNADARPSQLKGMHNKKYSNTAESDYNLHRTKHGGIRPHHQPTTFKYKAQSNLKTKYSLSRPKTSYKIGDTNEIAKALPASNPHCKLNNIDQNVFDLIVKFLQQYFTCYDKNRDDLLAAYHEKCIFSLSLNVNSPACNASAKFGSYFRDSRNLIHVVGNEKLFKMLHHGNVEIVSFLKKLPQTDHDSNTFKLDTTFFMQNMISFSIIGVFKEGDPNDKNRAIRSFQRVFVCVPTANGGMSIINEQLTISNLSIQQSKSYRTEKIQRVITQNVESKPTTSSFSNEPSTSASDELTRQNMIIEFSKFSNLTLAWSKDCLSFANWNFELAKTTFIEHKHEIPKEAFN